MRAVNVLVLLAVSASALEEDAYAWAPNDGVKALTAVEGALNKIISSPHLSPDRLAEAKKVVADVKRDVELVESGHNLTKVARNQKVAEAVAELMGLQKKWQSSASDKMAILKKQLAEKKAELEKDETMIKLLNMQKELAEKKMALQKLIDLKKKSSDGAEEEASRKSEIKLISTTLAEVKKNKDPKKPMQALFAELKTRANKVRDAVSKMDSEDHKMKDELKSALKSQQQLGQGKREDKKDAALLKMLLNKNHRKYKKARALKTAELVDLERAEASAGKDDVPGLEKVLAKMQAETKNLAAKSGNFLH